MPTTTLADADVPAEGMTVVDLMMACGMAKSRGEVRRLVEQGGITIDGERAAAYDALVPKDALAQGVKIRKGKKIFHRAVIG